MKTSAPAVPVIEVENEGLISLLDKPVLLFCLNYTYAGILRGVNDDFVKVEDPKIVYETGPFTDTKYKDAQSLNKKFWYVTKSSIESFGEGK